MQNSWHSEDAQIDLIIDLADRIVNVCEMKFWNGEYTITKKYAEELRRKLSDFQEHENLRKALHLVIVTTYGVKRNE